MRVRELQFPRPPVHPGDERLLGAGHAFGQREAGVVAGAQQQPGEQGVDAQPRAGREPHPRPPGTRRAGARRDDGIGGEALDGDQRRHHLGQRRRRQLLARVRAPHSGTSSALTRYAAAAPG